LGNVFDGLFADIYRGVDVGVRGSNPFDDTAGGPGTVILREPIDQEVVSAVEQVGGVAIAEGKVASGPQNPARVSRLNRRGQPVEEIIHGQAPQIGVTWGPHRSVNKAIGGDGRPEVGRRPVRTNEVALDQITAQDAGISFAEVRQCANAGGAQRAETCRRARVEIVFNEHEPEIFRVVAIFKFGSVGNLAGATLAAFDLQTAQTMLGREGKVDEIHVKAEPGVAQRELRDRILSTLREDGVRGIDVLTGKQLAKDQSDELRDQLQFFNIFLLIFALVAVFVGAFIIYNTFSIIVAQRTHELGLLRGLGASPRQVTGSVTLEALVVGLLSSVLGLVLGIGVALGLQELMKVFDIELPSGETVILGRTVIVARSSCRCSSARS
jgi:putative ABC transport system permease protein